MRKTKLPIFFKPYFWDVDFSSLDLTQSHFIIKRTLDRGNTKALKWLLNYYSKEEIINVILTSRDLSQKTANFWTDVFKLDPKKVICLQKPYSPIPFGLSS
ncbi:MAG: hypothetical protein ABIC96_04495 [Patescibacteria group bacterium]